MQYTRSQFQDDIFDPLVYPGIATTMTMQNFLNRVARAVVNYTDPEGRPLDLRSTKRRVTSAPVLFDGVYNYPIGSDIKGNKLIDIAPQANRDALLQWHLTTPEEFDRRKGFDPFVCAVRDQDGLKRLLASARVNSSMLVVSSLDSLTAGGGTWTAFGDGANLTADGDSYVRGSGSIRFDISAAGGTTAGIYNAGLDSFDISDYVNLNRSVFVWVYITSATNITNFKVRIGSSSSNYYEITVTTTNEATSFVAGWNLLRFDFSSKTTTGSPDSTACTYAALFMTKAVGKVSETGYRFDSLILEGGSTFDVIYYSKYPWQSSAGTYLANSTSSTDYLNADDDEYRLFLAEGRVQAARDRKDFDVLPDLETERDKAFAGYIAANPSEAMLLSNQYYDTWPSPLDQSIDAYGS